MAGGSFTHKPVDVDLVETSFRKIKTKLPVPESVSMLEQMYEIESRAMHGQYPMIWDRAEDFLVYDPWGNQWIDFTSTIFVTNAGHGNKRITKAIIELMNKTLIHTYTYANKERINYLNYLIKKTPTQFEKAFLLSSGTETTEVALKLMRLNAKKNNKRKGGVICFSGAYHGRTIGAQMMTGNEAEKEWIGYHDPNIFHLPFPYPWEEGIDEPVKFFQQSLKELLEKNNIDPAKDLCGIMLETFQGWGAIFYPKAYMQAMASFAKEYNLLLAFDEMQAGFGRTGKLFGYMHYDIEPDILCCGKGASSGLPLALVLGSKEVMDMPDVGSMSSTHSANPLCCVAGHENLKALLEDGLIDNSFSLGKLLHHELNKIKDQYPKYLKYILGEGLVAALVFYNDNNLPLSNLCDNICEKAFQKGLLVVHTGRESIKIAPPLSINKEALLEGLNVLENCIKEAIDEM